MVHSGMNEPLITLSWVWELDLEWVGQEGEGISAASTVTSSEIQACGLLLAGEADWALNPMPTLCVEARQGFLFIKHIS